MKVKIKKVVVNDNGDKDNNSIARRTPIERYAPFGNLAQQFQSQGWYPTSSSGTEFRPQYGLFSTVPLNDGKGTMGYVAIDHAGNGRLNLSIKDPSGKIVRNIINGGSAGDVNTYFTQMGDQQSQGNYNSPSPIAQRVAQIAQSQGVGLVTTQK